MSIKMNGPALMKIEKQFKYHFKISFRDFWDSELSSITGNIKIDLFKFNDWFFAQHDNFDEENISLNNAIKKEHGEEATTFIKQLI